MASPLLYINSSERITVPAPAIVLLPLERENKRAAMEGGGGEAWEQPMLEKRPSHRERHFTAGEVVRDIITGGVRRPHRALRPRRGALRRQRAVLARPHRRAR
jgi:hypothetical protein